VTGTSTDWHDWHRAYDDPGSDLSRRLASVQAALHRWLDERDDPTLTVVSACAGDGRDLLDVLAARPDAQRVRATLLELDAGLAARAAALASERGLDRVAVRRADAGRTSSYEGAVPADLVMMCGVLGNVVDEDVRRTVAVLPRLCAPGATVVWTRGSFRSGDLTPTIRGWLAEEGFEEVSLDAPDDATYRVGVHRLARAPEPLGDDEVFFTFVR
jgi:hypothetical protein